jgi:PHD/YefM family antitoxin component YafN of YafNO toxin-antitoxin module
VNADLNLAHIHPVSDFVRNYKSYLCRIKETGRPEVLTVNGVAECVLVDTKSYQEMKDAWEEARFIKAVNEGINSMNAATGKPNQEAFREIRATLDL